VSQALEFVNLIQIRMYVRKAWRYINLYKNGITGKLAEYAAQKYKSHRRLPEYVFEELIKFNFKIFLPPVAKFTLKS